MTLEEILRHPEHPLFALNTAYQAYVKKVKQARNHLERDASMRERVAFYHKELLAYQTEEEQAKARGLSVTFRPLQGDPRWGYFTLTEEREGEGKR